MFYILSNYEINESKHRLSRNQNQQPDNDSTEDSKTPYGKQLKTNPNLYILIIGPAGSGKTTLSKRCVLSTFQCNRYALFVPLMIVDPRQPIDLKYLLLNLGMAYFSNGITFSANQAEEALAWLLANQHIVTVVLDGLDQARFKISAFKSSSNINIRKKYLPSELLFIILSRQILPDVRLILTSRPHSVLNFSVNIQPDFVLFLDDLSEANMRILMSFYIRTDNVDQIISKLLEKSPRVQQLIYCPLFLRLFAILVNLAGLHEIWEIVQSTASLFDELLRRLQDCAHNAGEIDDTNVLNKIIKLAYIKTMEGSVVMDQNDLSNLSIEPSEIQDLAIGVHGESNSALVGPSLFYFAHQSIQVSTVLRKKVNYISLVVFTNII